MMTFICEKQGIRSEKEQAESGNGGQTAKADCPKSPLQLGWGWSSFVQVFDGSLCVNFSYLHS